MKRILIAVAAITISVACKKSPAAGSSTAATDALNKGINLSNWFNDYSDPAQFSSRFSVNTLQLIRSSGFTYVRLPVGATILFNTANPSQLNTANLAQVDAAVTKCISAGLAVTLNIHPGSNQTDSLLANDPSFVTKLAAYWKATAAYFKKYDSTKIFFEVYNEPHAAAGGLTAQPQSWWRPVQETLIHAIRQSTTSHYIVAGGEGWNSINGLVQMVPYNDDKVIYNFHFYDPFLFTHQGATWTGWQPAMDASGVPYPSSPAAVAPLVTAAGSNTELKNALQWYGSQQYNIDSLDAWIKKTYNRAQQYKVKVIANEFGSYKPNAPVQSRLNWIKDVRTVFEKYNIGWAMWEATVS